MVEADERQHRKRLWAELSAHDLGDLEPKFLRDLGIYGGAQGIWVDKARTGPLSRSGAGATVSILHTGKLHTGKHYPDGLSDEGVIYHYPTTARPPGRDAAEVEATKETRALGVPLFVILPGDRSPSRRRVRLGWVEDWDDATRQFLILFGDEKPTNPPVPEPDAPFVLTDEQPRRIGQVRVRAGQQRFRFSVLKHYGCKCAVCSITHPQLIEAAHIRSKAAKGTDDWRNGLPLCATHHAAFDAHLFSIEPRSLTIRFAPQVTAASIGVTATRLDVLRNAPHEAALRWRSELGAGNVGDQAGASPDHEQSPDEVIADAVAEGVPGA